jgi:predicted DNA-binding transcriptional regulator AlpA
MALKVITDQTPDDAMARANAICDWLDFSKATLWRKSEAGEFVRPIKLFEGTTAWRVGDVRAWLKSKSQNA